MRTHADEGNPVSEGDGDKLMGKYEIRLKCRIKSHAPAISTLMTSMHIMNAQNMASVKQLSHNMQDGRHTIYSTPHTNCEHQEQQ